MQPTFLPWLGYFSLLESVDFFVFLDNVQFEVRSWQQRNRIIINNKESWLTIPVSLPFGRLTRVDQALINTEHFSGPKICKTLTRAYGNKKGFDFIISNIFKIFLDPPKNISNFNVSLIKEIANALEVKTPFKLASEMNVSGSKGDLLLDICKNLGASTYISPAGSATYLDSYAGFFESGINLEYQTFKHPIYSQGEIKFISHLSVIDAICNVGLKASKEMIKKGSGLK
jgi:hypothetical protein